MTIRVFVVASMFIVSQTGLAFNVSVIRFITIAADDFMEIIVTKLIRRSALLVFRALIMDLILKTLFPLGLFEDS